MKQSPGSTLIGVLIICVILGLLIVALVPTVRTGVPRADHFACQKNLQNLYALLVDYKEKRGHYPSQSGIRFLLAPWTDHVCEHSAQNRDYLFCPAVKGDDPHYVFKIMSAPLDGLWPDSGSVTSADSNYAGPRQGEPGVSFAFESDSECIAADDNESRSNHPNRDVNALFRSGSIRKIFFAELAQKGVLKPADQWIPVGPTSPVAALRQLTRD